LYSGPAINVLAIVMTARILGWQLGLARALVAVVFAVVVGLTMAFVFRKDDANRAAGNFYLPEEEEKGRSLTQDALYMLTMVLILVFAAFAKPGPEEAGIWKAIFSAKWFVTGFLLLVLAWMLKSWFKKDELTSWVDATWGFTKQIFPLLAIGVIAAGFLLGRPGHPALIPEKYIVALVGGNSLGANLFASVAGALMYFATLTEVPIIQGLLGSGMGQGPALALLLAGPALSLPNMIVINGILGFKKTAVFVVIIVILSTIAGMIYGALV
jgi:uncharacterized membrane protein YraQ (UPF0718 family)